MTSSLRRLVFAFASSAVALASGHAGTLKVDINREGKNSASTTATGYTQWTTAASTGVSTTGTAAVSQNFTTSTGEPITITLAQTAASQTAGGTGLTYTYYALGSTTDGQKLASDGVTVAPAVANAGGEIVMTLTGLSPGSHTLLTYHNAGDSQTALVSMAPILVSVNGNYVTSVTPSIRAADTATPTAYLEFNVGSTADVTTILFAADTTSTATTKNAVLNGFELDTSNATRVASSPTPADADEHVAADSGSVTLSWTPAASGIATSRDVYFGTDLSAVSAATRTSPEFRGNQTALTWQATGLSSHLTYYWRIDEIDSAGTAKGTVWYFRPRHLAFPGAEGYGRFSRGGRGGKVVHVTSLADYTTTDTPVVGTLRYAIEQETGPRTIVFDVSGLITLESRLTLNSPYVTIAGQTAPGKGITLRKYTMGLSGAKDVIIRHLRSRPGNISGTTIDGMGMQGSSHCIIDHCSISWSLDEAFSSRSAQNITLQRTLISEALNAAGHQNYPVGTEHGYAASIGGDIGSFHHNLLAHNYGRNWSLAGGLDASATFAGRLDITNNVVYNWGARTTDGGAMEVNFVNNYYKPGAGTTHVPYALTMNHEDNFAGSQRAYFAGNVMPGHFDETNQTAGRRSIVGSGVPTPTYETFVSAPFFDSHIATQSAADAYKRVLSDVGANRPLIDDHDARIIRETLDGTFTYRGSVTNKAGFPDSQADVGGWENYPELTRAADFDTDRDGLPDWWETVKGLNKNSTAGDFSEGNADPDNDGYTQLEDYLNWIASPNTQVAKNASVQIDLSQLTRGYTASPVHAVSTPQNGTVTLGSDGKTATFTPTANFSGLASFTFTVTDSASSSMTGTVNLHVLSTELPPTITTQPASQTVTAGASVTLTVVATGNPTYQWKKNGLALTGATNASLAIASAQTSDSGSYTVDVTNSAATITSDTAILTVNPPPAVAPTITTQPTAQTVTLGASASFTVAASGTAPLTYQWQKDTVNITGATSATYSIPATQLSHAGQYRVIVSNSAGPVTSNAVALTLTSPAFAAPTPNGFAASATGGGNATPILVTTAADFKTQAESTTAAVITVGGTLDLNALAGGPLISVKSNKTIQGIDGTATIVGRLDIGASVSNVIIRGLNLTNAAATNGTPLTITGGSNVFVQNCTFFDAADHLATVTAGADNVTFAWCEFYYSSASLTPRRGILIGNTTGETKPLRVTLNHNNWSDFIDQRMPVTTYGHVHQYSNYLKPAAATPNTTATAVLANAQLLSERNVYENMVTPLTKSAGGLIRAIDNTYTNTSGTAPDPGTDTVFVPTYSYTTTKNTDLATEMTTYSGNTAGAASTSPTTTTASITGPSAAVANGASFTLNAVSTISSAITYQWRLNNAPISGATSASYAVTNAQTSHSGTYTVALTLTNGSTIVSTPFAVTVNAASSGGGGTTTPPASGGGGGGGGSPSLGFFAALALLTALRRRFRR
jgi:pectate lyase